jgi:hypothetical protein
MGGTVWPFNSSNTAEEPAAVTSNRSFAEKRKFCPKGSSASKTTVRLH